MAGITSVTFTYPLDIVRTRLSIQTASIASIQAQKRGIKPPGMWAVMANMYRNEGGWRALYRGIIPTIAGVAPYVGRARTTHEEHGRTMLVLTQHRSDLILWFTRWPERM